MGDDVISYCIFWFVVFVPVGTSTELRRPEGLQ